MTIDEKYGLPGISKQLHVSPNAFPEVIRGQFLGALSEITGLWRGMDIDAFRRGGVVYLRVTLDVGDRALHLFVHEDGDVVQFDAPVLMNFPQEASHFVLKEVCGRNTHLNFRVDEQVVLEDKQQGDQKVSAQKIEVLYGWGRSEFETFVDSARVLLPYLVAKLTQTEKELRTFLDEPPPQFKLVA